jgi:hypothetical protein
MAIDIEVEGAGALRETLGNLIPELQKRALRAGAQTAFDIAQNAADSHTRAGDGGTSGALARSVRLRSLTDGEEGFEVYHDLQAAPHALFVHWGTRPHEIRPRTRKVLRWPSGTGGNTGFRFARRVWHPGYKGDAWMIRAKDAALAAMQRIVESFRV